MTALASVGWFSVRAGGCVCRRARRASPALRPLRGLPPTTPPTRLASATAAATLVRGWSRGGARPLLLIHAPLRGRFEAATSSREPPSDQVAPIADALGDRTLSTGKSRTTVAEAANANSALAAAGGAWSALLDGRNVEQRATFATSARSSGAIDRNASATAAAAREVKPLAQPTVAVSNRGRCCAASRRSLSSTAAAMSGGTRAAWASAMCRECSSEDSGRMRRGAYSAQVLNRVSGDIKLHLLLYCTLLGTLADSSAQTLSNQI